MTHTIRKINLVVIVFSVVVVVLNGSTRYFRAAFKILQMFVPFCAFRRFRYREKKEVTEKKRLEFLCVPGGSV